VNAYPEEVDVQGFSGYAQRPGRLCKPALSGSIRVAHHALLRRLAKNESQARFGRSSIFGSRSDWGQIRLT